MERVQEILAAVRNRHQVLHRWKLRQRLKKGLSITCLFDGEPGTGKTLTAEVLACELGMHLMRVNTATVIDKYIGETEKNLERLFGSIKPEEHLLLFDEADSLFARRSQKMERSTDRYSNMDINVLLQLIERFDGVAVLTTNLKKSIDPAFERRISYKVHFPMPQEAERQQIWRTLLPEENIPTNEPIEYAYLATLEMSGGEIKNAVLRAAYRAAQLGQGFDTDLIMESALAEARASGRLVRHH
jgi:SpoVK/Ycf46/Vps4 family AAA+-type ATPase